MSWSMTSSLAPIGKWLGTLAFRLTAGYAISGLLTVFFATAGLYVVLVSELDRSTDLFIADKLNVLVENTYTQHGGNTHQLEFVQSQ